MESPRQAHAYESLEKLPFLRAKAEVIARFERHYVRRLLEETQGNVAEAARRAEIDRVTMFRLIRRCGLKGEPKIESTPPASTGGVACAL